MLQNRVSAVLAQPDAEDVMSFITTIENKLPFLVNLTSDEIRSLPKQGDKSRAFVAKALELATQNPGFLPRDFDIEEMRKDVKLFDAIYPLQQGLMKLSEKVNDTAIEVGSEAYVAALLVYNYAKSSGIGTSSLDGVIDDLGQRFARKASIAAKPAMAHAQ
jgi:hypothetical protein